MQVGDLVKHRLEAAGVDVVWFGIVTKKELLKDLTPKFCVIWTSGFKGWFYSHDLEVVCK